MLKFIGFKLIALLSLLLTMGCSSLKTQDYAAERPPVYFEEYFNGDLEGWGMFQRYSGRVLNRFAILLQGDFKNGKGDLNIKYVYTDGRVEEHKWQFTKVNDNQYVGTGDNVDGEIQAEIQGNCLHMKYKVKVLFNEEEHSVDIDEWYWKIDEKVVMNRGYMSKFFLPIGDSFQTIRRRR